MEPPAGLVYREALLTEVEEQELLDVVKGLDFEEIRLHGVVARRTAKHYGVDYDYASRTPVETADPVPGWLEPVREKAAALAGVRPEAMVEALVQRYPEGAPIGWHRDAPAFELVAGVSLLSPARMRFRRGRKGEREMWELELAPRSGYVLAGESRWKWEHHVPPAKALRYSITFRTLRGSRT
ncbi:MAG TPA: alpha-ketoglutarate-dependent dioxygenase AlkB [Gaiellaceae bacterium]|nr:alpha-ketoglutarate-dependent dioxygenase AlkB [Gaiellaceae bacterium]